VLRGLEAVEAEAREVQLAADEPLRPLDPARGVADGVPGLRELEAEVLDHRRPEALRLLDRDRVQLRVASRAEPALQTRHVRARDQVLGGLPDEGRGHAGNLVPTNLVDA